ncbi:hypothetical protein BJX61DRAFT_51311 [Aspergillus egyptiacus]|nr:hypothetical protein BJX61DRAFT_51311 [Aspergillus egyptiacus]
MSDNSEPCRKVKKRMRGQRCTVRCSVRMCIIVYRPQAMNIKNTCHAGEPCIRKIACDELSESLFCPLAGWQDPEAGTDRSTIFYLRSTVYVVQRQALRFPICLAAGDWTLESGGLRSCEQTPLNSGGATVGPLASCGVSPISCLGALQLSNYPLQVKRAGGFVGKVPLEVNFISIVDFSRAQLDQ